MRTRLSEMDPLRFAYGVMAFLSAIIVVLVIMTLVAIVSASRARAQPAPSQAPPTIEFLQGVIAGMQAQRDNAQNMHLGANGQNNELNATIVALRSQIESLTKRLVDAEARAKAAPPKPEPKDEPKDEPK